jgi:oligopeptidase A
MSSNIIMEDATATAASSSTAADNQSNNPLLQVEGLPKFQSIEPVQLTPAVDILLSQMEQDFSTLESTLQNAITSSTASATLLSYDDVLPVIERIQYPLSFTWGVAGHLNGVMNSDDLRQAYENNQPKIVQAMSKFSQSKVCVCANPPPQ